ncbi:BQ2448_2294 [Microbotryum intermedium]|uniref:BQ2448_2294 protein n=1 Tax=Microbotryum intermedium TaxID=269621 RepID=A0A238FBJ4_9BASI|nr:BQ2448_2294 [Microbotryum intermedium]
MNRYSCKPSLLPTPDSRTVPTLSGGGRARSLTAPSFKFALGDDCLPSVSDFRASRILFEQPGFSSTFSFKFSDDADVEDSGPPRPTTSIGPKDSFQHHLATRHPNGHLRTCSDSPATSPNFRTSQERGDTFAWRRPVSPIYSDRRQTTSQRPTTVMDRARYETSPKTSSGSASVQGSLFNSRSLALDKTEDYINQIVRPDTAESPSKRPSFRQKSSDAMSIPPSTVPNFLGDTSLEAAFADTAWSFDLEALDIGTFLSVPTGLDEDKDQANGDGKSASAKSSYHEKIGAMSSKIAPSQSLEFDASSSKQGQWPTPQSQSIPAILDITAYRPTGVDEPVPNSVQEMEHLAVTLRPTSQHHPDEMLNITTTSTSPASTIADGAFDQIDVALDDIILIQNSLIRAASLRLRTETVDTDPLTENAALDAAANDFVYSASSEGPFNSAWDEISRSAATNNDTPEIVTEAVPNSLASISSSRAEPTMQTQPQLGVVVPPTASRSIFIENELSPGFCESNTLTMISCEPSDLNNSFRLATAAELVKEQPGPTGHSLESKHRNLSVAVPPRIIKYAVDHEDDEPNSDDDQPLAHRANPQIASAGGSVDKLTRNIQSGSNVRLGSSRESLLIQDVRHRATLATLALKQGQGREGHMSVRKTSISGPTLMPDPASISVVPIRNPDVALTQPFGPAKKTYKRSRSSSQPLKIRELGSRFKLILKKKSRDCVALLNGDEVTPFHEHEHDLYDAAEYHTDDEDDTSAPLVRAEHLDNGKDQPLQPRASFYAFKPASRSNRSLGNFIGGLGSQCKSEDSMRSFQGPTHLATIPGSPSCAVEAVQGTGTPQGPEPLGRAPISYDINSRRSHRHYGSGPYASSTMPVPANDDLTESSPSCARTRSEAPSSYGEEGSISGKQSTTPEIFHSGDDTDALYGPNAEDSVKGGSRDIESGAGGASPLGDWVDADYILGLLENEAAGSLLISRRDVSSEHPNSMATLVHASFFNAADVDTNSSDSATHAALSTRSSPSAVAPEDLPCFTVSGASVPTDDEVDAHGLPFATMVICENPSKDPRSHMSLAAPLTGVEYRNSGYADSFFDLYALRSADRATFSGGVNGDQRECDDKEQQSIEEESSDRANSVPDPSSPMVKNNRNSTFWKMVGDLRHSRQSIDSIDHHQFNFDSRPPSMLGSDAAESIMGADLENARLAFNESECT